MENKIFINQYQSAYPLDQNQLLIVDFLKGISKIHKIIQNEPYELVKIFDEEIEKTSNLLLNKIVSYKKKSANLILIPSYACNLACTYCYEGENTRRKQPSIPSGEEIINATVAKFPIKDYETIRVSLLGGEPLLPKNIEFFDGVISRLNMYKKIKVNCITNGTTIIKYWNSIKKLNIDFFQITLDGEEKAHNKRRPPKSMKLNSFQSTIEGIDFLLKENKPVSVRINLDEDNLLSIRSLVKIFIKKGWHDEKNFSSYIYPISECGNDSQKVFLSEGELLKKLLVEMNTWERKEKKVISINFHGSSFIDDVMEGRIPKTTTSFCGACRDQIVFDNSGKVYTCWVGVGKESFTVGEKEKSKYVIDKNKYEKWTSRNSMTVKECNSCKFKFICGAGCSYKAISKSDSGELYTPRCSDYDSLFRMYSKFKYNIG